MYQASFLKNQLLLRLKNIKKTKVLWKAVH